MRKRLYFYILLHLSICTTCCKSTRQGGYFSQSAGYKGLNKALQLAAKGNCFQKSIYGRRIILELICQQKRHRNKNKQWADLKDNSAADLCRLCAKNKTSREASNEKISKGHIFLSWGASVSRWLAHFRVKTADSGGSSWWCTVKQKNEAFSSLWGSQAATGE